MSQGVKQVAVLSAILYCFYTDDLFKQLRNQKIGCWIQGRFTGAAGYADDNLVMAPTLEGLQKMMKTCEEFAKDHNLQFSTNENPKKSKTKCLAFLNKNRRLKSIKLNGNNLPWINTPDMVVHLGTKVNDFNDDLSADVMHKRAKYIQRNSEILQEFYFANLETKCKLNNIYNMSLYGCPL